VTRLPIALMNYEDGGAQPVGGYDFRPLQRAFTQAEVVPALVLYCEAKNYRFGAGEAKYAAAEALSDEMGGALRRRVGVDGSWTYAPAIFYNPNVLVLRRWWNQDDPGVYGTQRPQRWPPASASWIVTDARALTGAPVDLSLPRKGSGRGCGTPRRELVSRPHSRPATTSSTCDTRRSIAQPGQHPTRTRGLRVYGCPCVWAGMWTEPRPLSRFVVRAEQAAVRFPVIVEGGRGRKLCPYVGGGPRGTPRTVTPAGPRAACQTPDRYRPRGDLSTAQAT
jgi:hypothetical protein